MIEAALNYKEKEFALLLKEISITLHVILTKILSPDNILVWQNFCKSEESGKFRQNLEEIYASFQKSVEKTKKSKVRCNEAFTLMASILGFSKPLHEKHAETLFKFINSSFKPTESYYYEIIYYFLSFLALQVINDSNQQTEEKESTYLQNHHDQLLDTLAEHLFAKATDQPTMNDEIIKYLIKIGELYGKLGRIRIILEKFVKPILSIETTISQQQQQGTTANLPLFTEKEENKFAGISIISYLANEFNLKFTKLNYHTELFDVLIKIMNEHEKIVLQRDQCYLEQEKIKIMTSKLYLLQQATVPALVNNESTTASLFVNQNDTRIKVDISESIIIMMLRCFSNIEPPIEKQPQLLERITHLAYSPVLQVAESALYTLRDYLLVHPGTFPSPFPLSFFCFPLSLVPNFILLYLSFPPSLPALYFLPYLLPCSDYYSPSFLLLSPPFIFLPPL